MITTIVPQPTTTDRKVAQLKEASALALELWREEGGTYGERRREAAYLLAPLLDFADAWDRHTLAQRGEAEEHEHNEDGPMSQCPACGEWVDDASLELGCPSCDAARLELDATTPVYVPSALDKREQRAMDKALYMYSRGAQAVQEGRFWFVASRTNAGTVYRVNASATECSCKAGEAGRPCWHRSLVAYTIEMGSPRTSGKKLSDAEYEALTSNLNQVFFGEAR